MEGVYAEPGTEVILGRHTRRGTCCANWSPRQELYIGRKARILRTCGYDCISALCCKVDVDDGYFPWRVENMILASDVPLLTLGQKARLNIRF